MSHSQQSGPALDPETGEPLRKIPLAVTFFDPYPSYRVFGDFLGPVAFIRHLVIPCALFGILIAVSDWYALLEHMQRVSFSFSFIQMFVLSLLTVNLLSKWMAGTAMARRGVASRQFGMRLQFGILLKFFTDRAPTKGLRPREQRAVDAIPLLTKLLLFTVALSIWAIRRREGGALPDLSLAIAASSFGAFLFTANPLFPADGYKWLSSYLERPNLRQDSLRILAMILRRRPLPSALTRGDLWVHMIFGIATVLFSAFLLYLIITVVLLGLEAEYDGMGVLYFCIMIAMVTLFFISLRQNKRASKRVKNEQKKRRA
ncbi:MAG: hypothetical protein AAGF78_03950 [Pseudomonadota bacterium]